ncbi:MULTISPECIES: tRNA (adenosine(37)-N6)-threonylcarbamoyltransferase complex dimerization subunit type 1 TsaB [unclassified Leeuwenhoekiella]|uniref:tRNA (adenosine(37)-N6)-threonylcarbamoyltransferase complex dimerization subunit type 1 TsaB n=1 Tax=unclassified Leeuwenhoekiella TaxID=2615029 RepID=UPI000C5A0BCB|nr:MULTISPECIES: tRNA (adenosine(37)-N6)-threonylcarbamoyltransferase complex dimerization subunit type 1 TsaB [unclassified Leeuwenhoekiella]MAW96385.1 tRNA (adenosine(37)-N6)-threonylcarbamoyltransferase complex dimerization subunit type 1 TsaB [Leeuwenhoekiella sp.]MBA81272.1 tRNA (adenosine(37)-N6)-threonylcarbamoyltransferase complex dimerization subunit type 1 TsaB [Leeuwenhoekiella sp.]|tara:strand:- start:44557 stop:45228 length:672 start_codon:yes stop_codon:yes gene_type:complete
MAIFLCIETTTTNCSVALAKDDMVVAFKEDMGLNYSHAERLHIYIAEVLKEADIPKSEIDAIAVSKGPGSYTGLRIGVSAAKGLCFALNIPLIATNTLKALAMQVNDSCDYIIPVLDARRMEVYSAVFNADFDEVRGIKAQIVAEDSFTNYLNKGKVVFIGNGAAKLKDLITHPNARFNDVALPSAREMVTLANAKYKISDTEDVAYFEPYYLKDFYVTSKKK